MKKEENNKLSIVGKNENEVKKTIEIEKVSLSENSEKGLEKKKFNPIEDMKETLFMGVIESVLPKISSSLSLFNCSVLFLASFVINLLK